MVWRKMARKRARRSVPEWADARSPKVLIENSDPAMAWADARALGRAGYETRSCSGPEGPSDIFPYGGCLLVEQGACPLAQGADVILFGLGLGHPEGRRVLGALRSRIPATPVCIDAPESEVSKHPELVLGCTVIPFPDQGLGLMSALRRALDGTNAEVSPPPHPSHRAARRDSPE